MISERRIKQILVNKSFYKEPLLLKEVKSPPFLFENFKVAIR